MCNRRKVRPLKSDIGFLLGCLLLGAFVVCFSSCPRAQSDASSPFRWQLTHVEAAGQMYEPGVVFYLDLPDDFSETWTLGYVMPRVIGRGLGVQTWVDLKNANGEWLTIMRDGNTTSLPFADSGLVLSGYNTGHPEFHSGFPREIQTDLRIRMQFGNPGGMVETDALIRRVQ